MRFVINGIPECPNYNHAVHVAQYLSEKLPTFCFKKIEKCREEWNIYLKQINKENKWHITRSPLIWKELNMWGGKKYLVGGLSEFWEYVWCYYGLESIISKEDLKMLGEDNLTFFLEQETARHKNRLDICNLTILCSTHRETIFLLEMIVGLEFFKARGAQIKLYNASAPRVNKLQEYASCINEQRYFPIDELVIVVEDLAKAVQNCDLLITMNDYKRRSSESEDDWLNRCLIETHKLANALNSHAKHNIRIIVNDYDGPVCFIATALVELCPKIRPCDIVAITSHEGLSVINAVSKLSKVPVSQISAPPVWGSTGIHTFVDERNIICKAYVYKPFERSLNAPPGTTLPLGTKKSELRMMSYLISTEHDQMMKEILHNKENAEFRLERSFFFPKLRALESLLNIWYDDKGGDEIISLGICSNGSFDIPTGLVFSQPVSLNSKKKWIPYRQFPLMNSVTKQKIAESVEVVTNICRKFGFMLDQRMSVLDRLSDLSWYTFIDG